MRPLLLISILWIAGSLVSGIYGRPCILDDAFITFRYARNVANGFGFVWNIGGPQTEGFTSLLHVVLLVPGFVLGIKPETFSFVLNDLALLSLSFALYFTSRSLLGRLQVTSGSWTAAIAPAIVLVDPLVWANSNSGLETMLYVAAMLWTICFHSIKITTKSAASFWGMCTSAVLSYTLRPEGILLTLFIALLFVISRNWEQLRRFALAVAIPIACLLLFRLWYFGDIFPNSFYVKVRNPEAPFFAGLQYERLFMMRILPILVLAGVGVVANWRDRSIQLIAASVVAQLGFFALVDPIMGDYDRFLLPVQVILAIPASIAIVRLLRARSTAVAVTVVMLLAIIAIHSTRAPRTQSMIALVTTARDNVGVSITETLKALPHASQLTMAYTEAGRVAYYTPEAFLDLVGLNHNKIARERSVLRRVSIVFEENPDIIFMPVIDSTPPLHAYLQVPSQGGALFKAMLQDHRLMAYSPIIRFRDPRAAYTWVIFLNSASAYRDEIVDFARARPAIYFHPSEVL